MGSRYTFKEAVYCGGLAFLLDSIGAVLVKRWAGTPSNKDGTISGILADWVEENKDLLIFWNGDSPHTRQQIEYLLNYLRMRLNSSYNNQYNVY